MLFFAQADNKSYQIEVREKALKWEVAISEVSSSTQETHVISKKDFRQFGELISFLFRHSSYLIDIVNQGDDYTVFTKGSLKTVQLLTEERLLYNELTRTSSSELETNIKSKMPGKIVEIHVKDGELVKEGGLLLVVEAMKMENEIRSNTSGVVQKIHVKENQNIETGTLLLSIKPEEKK